MERQTGNIRGEQNPVRSPPTCQIKSPVEKDLGKGPEPSHVASAGLGMRLHPSAEAEQRPGELTGKDSEPAFNLCRKKRNDPLVMPALGVGGERGCTFATPKLAIPRQLAVHGLGDRGGEES